MIVYGLIGYPLSHSFSRQYFSDKFQQEKITGCTFLNFEIQSAEEIESLLEKQPEIAGLSVTIPHKETIIPFLNELDESALSVGAVNCIKRFRAEDGQWILKGFNTDVHGFSGSLKPILKPHHTRALILGTGGASKAVAAALERMNVAYSFVSRSGEETQKTSVISYNALTESTIQECPLIINTTPLGMLPDIDTCPAIPYEALSTRHLLFDLIYNPSETLFLKKGKRMGASIKNGLEMLHLQAEKAWSIWNAETFSL